MTRIVIRKMRESDLGAVSDLATLANPHANKEYCTHLRDELTESPDLAFVAINGNKVVGYVQAETHKNMALLEDIAVAKECQRQGIGTKLLIKEIEAARRRKAEMIFAEVHYKCSSAIPFYYSHGFRISGFGQDYFGIGHDAIVLKLSLKE